jgi:hypothetical protein
MADGSKNGSHPVPGFPEDHCTPMLLMSGSGTDIMRLSMAATGKAITRPDSAICGFVHLPPPNYYAK